MKLKLTLFALLVWATTYTQTTTLNTNQIRPGANGQVLKTVAGVPTWSTGSDSITALNGLTLLNDTLKLGGLLVDSTVINQGDNSLSILSNTGKLSIGIETPRLGFDFDIKKSKGIISSQNFSPLQLNNMWSPSDTGGVGISWYNLKAFGLPSVSNNNYDNLMLGYSSCADSQTFAATIYHFKPPDDYTVNMFTKDFRKNSQPGFATHPWGADYYFYKYNIEGSGTDGDVTSWYIQDSAMSAFVSFQRSSFGNWLENSLLYDKNGFYYGYKQNISSGNATSTQSEMFFGDSFIVKRCEIVFDTLKNTRDDAAVTTPTNFIYTDASGKLQSTTLGQILKAEQKDTQTGLTGTALTLPATPLTGTLKIFKNGMLLDEGGSADYTISGANVTFSVALISSDKIKSFYY